MTPTKQRIVASAIRLFNEQGVAEVRLQQIADAAGMSTGNLAYHFSNKEAILEAAILQAHEALAEVLRLFSSHPNLLDFEVQLAQLSAQAPNPRTASSWPAWPSSLSGGSP